MIEIGNICPTPSTARLLMTVPAAPGYERTRIT